jgi:phage-related protein
MVLCELSADEKPLHWVGSSKRDFLSLPAAAKEDMGNALGIAQFGGAAPTAKPWKGLGPGVLEVVESHDGSAYRAVYTVRFEKAVYVLHAFQKSPSGTGHWIPEHYPSSRFARSGWRLHYQL